MKRNGTLLIVYDSHDGQTELIAQRLASTATKCGTRARAAKVSDFDTANLALYDAVIVAAPIRFDRHPRSIRKFVRQHVARRDVYSAFISVSGSSAKPDGEAKAREYVVRFLGETGWSPDAVCLIGGAIKFTQYNPLLRFVMKRIAARRGLPTDTRRDYEYTDWAKLEQFAEAFVSGEHHALMTGV